MNIIISKNNTIVKKILPTKKNFPVLHNNEIIFISQNESLNKLKFTDLKFYQHENSFIKNKNDLYNK